MGMLSYLSYLLADISGLSGILSLFCCGICVSHWALPRMSEAGRVTTLVAFETLSHLAEGVIFIYVGMDALDPHKWSVSPRTHSLLWCYCPWRMRAMLCCKSALLFCTDHCQT